MSFRPLPARTPAILLQESPLLRRLIGQARRLDQLQQLLDSQLQPAARPYCRIAAWRDGYLLLIVTDAGWATRLRYQERRLLRTLQALGPFQTLLRILFRVRPAVPLPEPGPPPVLSGAAASTLRATARGITDPRLRQALEQLAGKARGENAPAASTQGTNLLGRYRQPPQETPA